jgi:hypothetical protein
MESYARIGGTRSYTVEVSGWACTQDFFVERCDLVWNEDTGGHVVLNQNARDSAVLIVRLLEADKADRSHPTVYEAQLMGRTPSGHRQFRLTTVAPRVNELKSAAG